MARLIDTQKMCDKRKYLESEKTGRDLSGDMDYCSVCLNRQENSTCALPHAERFRTCACARAYNLFKRKK